MRVPWRPTAPPRRSDRLLGIAIGIVLGLVIVIAIVFILGPSIDAPSIE